MYHDFLTSNVSRFKIYITLSHIVNGYVLIMLLHDVNTAILYLHPWKQFIRIYEFPEEMKY